MFEHCSHLSLFISRSKTLQAQTKLHTKTVKLTSADAGHLVWYVTNQPTKANSAFHLSGVGK